MHTPIQLAIPVAVAGCLALDTALAIASLGCGLVFGPHQLQVRELVNVLVARSLDGERWDIGPNFWIVHTTFLPVVFYLGLVLLSWSAKSLLIPTEWLLKRGHHPDINPLAMTSRLVALIAAVCTAVMFGLGFVTTKAK